MFPVVHALPRSAARRAAGVLLLVAALVACSGGSGSGAVPDPGDPGPVAPALPAVETQVDMLAFGDAASEAAHGVTAAFAPVQATVAPVPAADSATPPSEVITGEQGQPARRLLPRTPNGDYYGGELRFTMAVDPVRENYFSVKLSGTEVSESWLVLEVNGLEVGGRHMTDDESLLLNSSGWLPNRFIYRTVRLPWHVTRGQTQVSVRLRSIGRISYYSTGYDSYQKRMVGPTVALYRAYTHLAPYLAVGGEAQGPAPVATRAAAATAEEEAAWLAAWKERVNGQLTSKLAASAASLTADDLDYLAQGYGKAWTSIYQNAAVVDKVVASFDAKVVAYSAAPTTYLAGKFSDNGGNGGWGGNFGQIGSAILLLWPQLQGLLDTQVAYGGVIGTTTRRDAWGTALRASVDFGRFNRRTISNQEIDGARRVYAANAALRVLDPSKALDEAEARRYLHEAYGAAPFMGNDQPGGGPVPVRGTAPYGPNWFMSTARGTTKEDCLVGGDYGEQGASAVEFAETIGDPVLLAQGLKMLRARLALRKPGLDADGHLTSHTVELVGCRNDHWANRYVAYLTRGGIEALQVGRLGAAVIGSDLLGYLQQQADEGQLLPDLAPSSAWLNGFAGKLQVVRVPDDFAAFKAHARTVRVLPMSVGEPDFAWADEENMVVAARRGEERLWVNLYWRGPDAINRLARVVLETPQRAHVAEVSVDDVQYQPAGTTVLRDGKVDNTPPYGYPPPDNPVNVNNGLVLPVALRPDLSAVPPTNRDAGRGTAYTLRYGNWLLALNAHPSQSYTPPLPRHFSGGRDLVSGTVMGAQVTVPPKSAVVFYLDREAPSELRPANPLTARAIAGNGNAIVTWAAAPGAAAYRVLRATEALPAFTAVATVTGTSHADTGLQNGERYVYVVEALDAEGIAGGRSPAVRAQPLASSLPAPWVNLDIGAASSPGNTTLADGAYTMTSLGTGLFGTADAGQFAFVPLPGDGSITARVVSQVNSGTQAPAAVTLRESLEPGSRHVSLAVTPAFGIHFRFRTATGAATGNADRAATLRAPYWVRLVRSGALVSAFVSPDGVTWTANGTLTLGRWPDSAYIGLWVGNGLSATGQGSARFDNVTLAGPP